LQEPVIDVTDNTVRDDFTENSAVTVPYSVGTISSVEMAAAEKYELIPWEQRAKGWSPDSGKSPTFKDVPANATVNLFVLHTCMLYSLPTMVTRFP
jgi:hypothetical protein